MRPRRAGHGSRRLGPRRPRRLRERRPFGPRRGRTARITTGPGRRIRVRRSAAVDCATRPDAQPLPFHPSHTPPCPLIACLPACLPACKCLPATAEPSVQPAPRSLGPGAARRAGPATASATYGPSGTPSSLRAASLRVTSLRVTFVGPIHCCLFPKGQAPERGLAGSL